VSFQCNWCGESWEKNPVLSVPCPTCQVPAGRRCVRPSEHKVPMGDYHQARARAAYEAGFLGKCHCVHEAQASQLALAL
jgi:hypothetical protein